MGVVIRRSDNADVDAFADFIAGTHGLVLSISDAYEAAASVAISQGVPYRDDNHLRAAGDVASVAAAIHIALDGDRGSGGACGAVADDHSRLGGDVALVAAAKHQG